MENIIDENLVNKAMLFAAKKHGEVKQKRKYTGEDYICHPARVVALLRTIPHTTNMLCAAWLHDTVEDTITTPEEIKQEFGSDIAKLVAMLTKVGKPEDGNRAARKRMDREHLAKASNEAKTIKIADLLDNSQSIITHDKKFAEVFMPEIGLLLGILNDGDRDLYYNLYKTVLKWHNDNGRVDIVSCNGDKLDICIHLKPELAVEKINIKFNL